MMSLSCIIAGWLLRCTETVRRSPPDVEISRPHCPAYLHRWHLVPRNRFLNVYLHVFHGDDPGDDLHDHPWWSLSLMLRGTLREIRQDGLRFRAMGDLVLRDARTPHRLERVRPVNLAPAPPPVSLFITGPRFRKWGFWTDSGWVGSKAYRERLGVRKT